MLASGIALFPGIFLYDTSHITLPIAITWMCGSLVFSCVAMLLFRTYKVIVRHTSLRDLANYVFTFSVKDGFMLAMMWPLGWVDSSIIVALVVDLVLNDTDNVIFDNDTFVNVLLNDSYISSDGQFIVVSGFSNGKIINIFYDPKTGEAQYSVRETTLSDDLCAQVLKEAGDQLAYNYLNDKDLIVQVVQIMQEALENSN